MIRRFAFSCLHTLSYLIWLLHPVVIFFVLAGVVLFTPRVINVSIHPTWSMHKDLKEQILKWYLEKA